MKPGSFEQLDREMMKNMETMRLRPVPPEIRKDFRRSVEQRILLELRGGGFSLMTFAVPLCVLALGAALCWFYLRPPRIQPPAETVPQKKETVQVRQPVPAVPREVRPARAVQPVPVRPVSIQLPVITENNVVDEIEALKELGAWTDQDETDIGIPADQSFAELDLLGADLVQGAPSGQP